MNRVAREEERGLTAPASELFYPGIIFSYPQVSASSSAKFCYDLKKKKKSAMMLSFPEDEMK